MAWGAWSRRWGAPLWALAGACLLSPAHAEPAQFAQKPKRQLDTVLFGSLDAGRTGYASAGFKRTWFGPLDKDGLATLAAIGYGGAPERVDAFGQTGFRHKASASALIGYQWFRGPMVLAGFVGPELDYEQEPAGAAARPRFGARAQAEFWAHPTPSTLVTVTAIAGSARGHLWTRASAGYAVWERVFVGPEAAFYGTSDYREWRFGAHVTGLRLWGVTLRLSGGVGEFDGKTGGYVGLSGYIRM
jgi:hypothetical protein